MLLTSTDFKALVGKWAELMYTNKDRLIQMDGIVGDSDLGLTMSDGFKVAYDAIARTEETDIGKLSYFAGKAMASAVPSTMGTLMASGFMEAGKALKDKNGLNAADVYTFFSSYAAGIQKLGGAKPGEKTFLDGWTASLEKMRLDAQAGVPLNNTAEALPDLSHADLLATGNMLAKHGRAAARGEQARSMLDPGAAVAELMIIGYNSYINRNQPIKNTSDS